MGKAFQQFIAEVVVIFALPAQAFSIEGNGAGQIQRFRVKMPAVRRDQPGPPEDVTLAEGFDRDMTPFRREQLKRNPTFSYEIELIRLRPLPENELVLFKSNIGRTTCYQLKVLTAEILEERVLDENAFERFHGSLLV
jgi:hypothetical protein